MTIALIGASGYVGSAILHEALWRGHHVTAVGRAEGARDALQLLRGTMLSPSALLERGIRTGKFRLGTDQLLVDAAGESYISLEDYAVAMLDELERPMHLRQRFTVGY